MIRFASLLLAATLFLPGCGETDRSRVIPITDEDSKPASASKVPSDQLTPTKIPMH